MEEPPHNREESFFDRFHWERLPNGVFLFPLIVWAVLRTLWSGTIWTLSTSNPGLIFGGFFGYPKSEAYAVLPPDSYPKTILMKPKKDSFEDILRKIESIALVYPFIVKPDGGMVGLLVRVINNEDQLRRYFDLVKADWMAQELIPYQTEVGVFYVRHPNEEKGRIVGLSQKVPLSVIGDGKTTVGDLVRNNSKTAGFETQIFEKQKHNWNKVPADGEFYQLIFTGNRKNGATLVELIDQVDDEMLALFDRFSHFKNGIYYGRYDIKCESLESLKKGEKYGILEFNGSHSGYGHLYHCGKSWVEVYRKIYHLWNDLFDISVANHKKGLPYISFFGGWKFIYRILKTFKKLSKWERELQ
jgi:hypothetical protein